ncbi:MAG: carbon-nitrogen family hydrolase [Candidatus Nanopelagicales bacterium]
MEQGVRVALVQLEVSDAEAPAARVERVAELVRAQRGRAGVVILPELWHVGAFALALARTNAEPLDGPLVTQMRSAAADAGVWVHAGSFAELDPISGSRYNTSVLLSPDGAVVETYRKQHLFGWEGGESSVMSAGTGLSVAQTPLGSTGLVTCYDLRFPELFRALVAQGAATFLLTSGWPAERIEHWSVLARARAIENQAWVVACNTSGTHNGVRMGGRSLVVDPMGAVVVEAGEDEQVLYADIDPDVATKWRESFPVLADRRL